MTQPKDEQTQADATPSEELSEEQLSQVNGGLIGLLLPAVQKVRDAAAADGSVIPTDQVSLNFTKTR